MEFIKPTKEEWKVISELLDLPEKLNCSFCKCKVVLGKNSSILPSFKNEKRKFIVVCDSPLCLSTYLTMQEAKT